MPEETPPVAWGYRQATWGYMTRDGGYYRTRWFNTRVRQTEENSMTTCSFAGCEEEAGLELATVERQRDFRCPQHTRNCYHCGCMVASEGTLRLRDQYGRYRVYCRGCTAVCTGCTAQIAPGAIIYVEDSGNRCRECCTPCDCGRGYYCDDGDVEECYMCRTTVRDVDSYHHTRPSMWLGGPVKNQGGYYLGFELEITTDSYAHGTPVKEWARENLGTRDAMSCKEDSSVNGFEIVTQPMTPEFFESVDWDDFFDMLNAAYPLRGTESTEHGLHVHIGRRAFNFNDLQTAAFAYLIGQDNHLERVARRSPTSYCRKVEKPVSEVIYRAKQGTKQAYRISRGGNIRAGRDAINLNNDATIEIRAFRSTRRASELRDAVRFVYVCAEYVRFLTQGKKNVNPRALHWDQFTRWVAVNYPDAFRSIAGLPALPEKVRGVETGRAITARSDINYHETQPEDEPRVVTGHISRIDAAPGRRPVGSWRRLRDGVGEVDAAAARISDLLVDEFVDQGGDF